MEASQNCERGNELLEEIFNCWEISSYDEKTEKTFRKPMSKEQMDKSQNLLNQIKQLNCEDEEIQERTKELQDVVDYQNKRVFVGNSITNSIVIGYGILTLVGGIAFFFINTSSSTQSGFLNIIFRFLVGILFLFSGLNYKKALSPPNFLIDGRNHNESKPLPKVIVLLGSVGSFLVNIYDSITKSMLNSEITHSYKQKWSDGSVTHETEMSPLPILGVMMLIIKWGYYLTFVTFFSPLYVGYNYLKNYVWYK